MVDFVKLKDEEKKNNPKKKKPFFLTFKGFLLVFLLFFLLSSLISTISYTMTPKIAVVPITGPITTEKETTLYGTSTSSREIASTLLELKKDSTVKAVVLDINSPGGSPVASEEISRAIESLKEEKEVYSLINDVGASGAFWIAVSTNKIYASSMSIIGSIGVTSATLSFEDFIKEHNISYRKQTAGELKDMGSIFRKQTPIEEEKTQELLDEIHSKFIAHVAVSRNMSYEEVKQFATGEIFLGSKALEIGFIDEIGYYPDVLNDLKNQSENILVVNYGPEPSLLEAIGVQSSSILPSSKSQILLQ